MISARSAQAVADRTLRIPARVIEYLTGNQAWADIQMGLQPDCDEHRASILRKIWETTPYKTGEVMLRGEITDGELLALDESVDLMATACYDNRHEPEERKNLHAAWALRARIEHLGLYL